MKPGDLVMATTNLYFYTTISRLNKRIPQDFAFKGTSGIILEQPNGTWVKWLMPNGQAVWSNWNYLEVIA